MRNPLGRQLQGHRDIHDCGTEAAANIDSRDAIGLTVNGLQLQGRGRLRC